jgi:hypothetical protein
MKEPGSLEGSFLEIFKKDDDSKFHTKMCLGISRHILDGQMGSQGKKKELDR